MFHVPVPSHLSIFKVKTQVTNTVINVLKKKGEIFTVFFFADNNDFHENKYKFNKSNII
jgi:hypothetical protein